MSDTGVPPRPIFTPIFPSPTNSSPVRLPALTDYRTGLPTDDPAHLSQLRGWEKAAEDISKKSKLYPFNNDD